LALAETEARIGNNATGVWKELFRIQLSGTATPFSERMELLGNLFFSSDPAERGLAFEALKETLNFTGTRMVGPSVVAGQIVPPDWRPASGKEFQDCLELILALFDRIVGERGSPDLRDTAWSAVATHLPSLLSYGMLPRLKEMVQRRSIPDACLPDLLQSLDDFLHYECGGKSGGVFEDSVCQEAAEWLRALTPVDFAGRLKAVIGKDPWHHSMREELSGIPSEIIPLAEEVSRDPAKLQTVLPYLNSPAAASAALFGDALASLDTHGNFMDDILSAADSTGSNALARGYIGRLMSIGPSAAERLNTWLDRFEENAPELAYWKCCSKGFGSVSQ
jgi:hypothetical protein